MKRIYHGARLLAAGLAAWAVLGMGPPAHADCTGLVPGSVRSDEARRDVTARDLIELRDIGAPDASNPYDATPLAVSPDRRRVAFVLSRADLDANGYCQALLLVDLDRRSPPRIVDRGGERMAETFSLRGARLTDGWPAIVTPRWSPDGRSIGYLKRIAGITQLWVAAADGSGGVDVSHASADVETWAWTPDGQSLVFTTRPSQAEAVRAIEREGRIGYLYDARFWPDMAAKPMPPGGLPLKSFVADRLGHVRAAVPGEAALVSAALDLGGAEVAEVVDGRGWRAVAEQEGQSPLSPRRLKAKLPSGRVLSCSAPACSDGLVAMWWDRGSLLYLRREGWDHEENVFYRWMPGASAPRRLFVTLDALEGCVFTGRFLCLMENATTPRRLAAIDPDTGGITALFDPNPEFGAIRLGRVERLHTVNAYGLKGWADLVTPPDYAPGKRLPTIIVQYSSRGFLRGGTGVEYPIFLFAARGYAVLSLQQPPHVSYAHPEITSFDQANALALKDWGERRSQYSAVEKAIDAAVAKGVADPARLGITGLSDGGSTVQFALAQSNRFAAAAMSSCCLEPRTVTSLGIAWADYNRNVIGYPPATRPDPAFWAPFSLAQNAARIDTPLLLQMADREYLQALETFTALREEGKPVEMYVFPDEYHTKVQPQHHLAVALRSLDWFDFWIEGREDPDPAKAGTYTRWRAMRAARTTR